MSVTVTRSDTIKTEHEEAVFPATQAMRYLGPMTQAIGVHHPSKLYEMLCACPSAEARAKAALEFLCTATDSPKGYLFLPRQGELVAVASSDGKVPSEVATEAALRWQQQQQAAPLDDRKTNTVDIGMLQGANVAPAGLGWTAPSGALYGIRVLSMFRGERWVSVALVMLQPKDARSVVSLRHAHVEALCNALIESGDVPEVATVS